MTIFHAPKWSRDSKVHKNICESKKHGLGMTIYNVVWYVKWIREIKYIELTAVSKLNNKSIW